MTKGNALQDVGYDLGLKMLIFFLGHGITNYIFNNIL